jgi:hypothetical protein
MKRVLLQQNGEELYGRAYEVPLGVLPVDLQNTRGKKKRKERKNSQELAVSFLTAHFPLYFCLYLSIYLSTL